jgi:cob(I)alamin adenosyltransferase
VHVRLTKIYTKVGDKGTTLLANGERVSKDAARIEAYGTVDELGSFLALWRDAMTSTDSRKFADIQASIARLEHEMDAYNESLAPLANFVLPGGHQANSLAHVCRTICRRAERHVVHLAGSESVRDEARIYLNRLSDWLFVASRVVSARLGCPEVLWKQTGKP